jgi:2-(1,2-epoxy-1,2-dihydrophenyl)acetyl-CoA isomerase
MADQTGPVRSELVGATLVVILDDPTNRNAFTPTVRDALSAEFARAVEDRNVRSIVLTGAGAGFCSGGDTRAMGTVTEEQKRASMMQTALFVESMVTLPKPIVAAVHGYAVGAGISLSLACDVIVAAEDTRFIVGFTALGLVPDMGAHFFLQRSLGARKTKELLWDGGRWDADTALKLGLVNRVVPTGDALTSALALANSLASGPTLAFAATKQIIADLDLAALRATLQAEADTSARLRSSYDHVEGVTALREKRPPEFLGR